MDDNLAAEYIERMIDFFYNKDPSEFLEHFAVEDVLDVLSIAKIKLRRHK